MDLGQKFDDVIPIPQDEGPNAVCSITYPDGFDEAMNYFRAILDLNEHSERALDLTGVCIQFNPANYTTWWFRRQILASLSSPPAGLRSNFKFFDLSFIEKDLELARNMGGSNPKNYQIWYHRRSILEQSFVERTNEEDVLTLIEDELDYIASVLKEDPKHYHAWSHRQWTLQAIKIEEKWEAELSFIDMLLDDDVRNNSAWNQRWLVSHRGSKSASFSLRKAEIEIDYAIEKARLDVYNESPWKYFVAIVKEQCKFNHKEDSDLRLFLDAEKKIEETKTLFEETSKKDSMECIHLHAAYIDILEIKGDKESCEKALDFVNALETRYDPIRKKYWRIRGEKLQKSILEE